MKMILTICLSVMAVMPMHAQTMADVLRTMPDSILPLLTQNDRLDLVDEWQGGVKAEVKNRLGGMVQLTELTTSSARLQMSSVSYVVLELRDEGRVIAVVSYCENDGVAVSYERRYSQDWKELKP